jgi:hypothetical protein
MKYFTISELTKSATAKRLGIDNTADASIRANLTALVENVLDPLRVRWGMPIIVTSGYRSTALNKAVGGAALSQHTKGEAADIRTVSDSRVDNMKLLRCLLRSGIVFDQVIAEYVDAAGRPDWIHVSFKRNGANRGSKLTATRKNGKTVYVSGIVV